MNKSTFGAQSRQSARLFLQSSELGTPTPSPSVKCAPWFGGQGHTRLREPGEGGPNSDEGTDNVVLEVYTVCTSWFGSSKASVFYYKNK